jgi:hypothetical protein
MFSFLQRELPAAGRVLYRGAIPPPLPQLSGLQAPVTCTPAAAAAHQLWAVEVTHPDWGAATIACLRQPQPIPAEVVEYTVSLTGEEKARARLGESTVTVKVRATKGQVLKDRKRLLRWLRALMQSDGVVAVDEVSTLFWSETMLDDELAHNADLDIESLYAMHAVLAGQDSERVGWLHTHGLEELGAFDLDVLQPSPNFVDNCSDPLRALAFAALEGMIAPDVDRFTLAYPNIDIRLVPVDRFQADAAPEHQALRDTDAVHSGRRSVICEPVGGLFGRWRGRPVPSRTLSRMDGEGLVVPFSTAATTLMAERARQTLDVFRNLKEEFASLGLPAVVKLGYDVEGGSPTDREHLWFAVHQLLGDKVDATLANAPHHVPSLTEGQRGEFSLDRLTDWVVLSPEGSMTPRNVSAARRLRANREMWQARLKTGA